MNPEGREMLTLPAAYKAGERHGGDTASPGTQAGDREKAWMDGIEENAFQNHG